MKQISVLAVWLSILCSISTTCLRAQAIAPEKSAAAAAQSDTRFIANNIRDHQQAMILLKTAMDRSSNPRVRELAEGMMADHTSMLYSLQELSTAGSGGSDLSAAGPSTAPVDAAALQKRLNGLSGADFDTTWVSNMLLLHQVKLDELTQAKTTVTNPQLKMAVTEAIPMIRKQRSTLSSLQKELARAAMLQKKQAASRQR